MRRRQLGGAPSAPADAGYRRAVGARGRTRIGGRLAPPGARGTPGGEGRRLFPWTLAKAFLSSPAAMCSTIDETRVTRKGRAEARRLLRLRDLAAGRASMAPTPSTTPCANTYCVLASVPRAAPRVVIFAERVDTLAWIAARLRARSANEHRAGSSAAWAGERRGTSRPSWSRSSRSTAQSVSS